MNLCFETYVLLFIIYSIFGWIIEVINELITCHRFVNRGFLIGPYCPIYGCGGVLITFLLSKYYNHPVTLFILAIVICSLLEYFTSYFMEKLFNLRWWDYSNRKYNINGRICAETMIPFGILGLVMIYLINPLLFKLFSLFTIDTLHKISLTIIIVFLLDCLISLFTLVNIKSDIKFYEKDNTAEIASKIKDFLFKKNWSYRRILNAYPNIKLIVKENFNKIISKEKYEQEKLKIETEAKIEKLRLENEYKISKLRKKAEEKLKNIQKKNKN